MTKSRRRVCVLVSGGVDSAVLTADRLSRGEEVYPLYVRCGLRWEDVEIRRLKRYLAALSRRGWPGRLRPLTVGKAPVSPVTGQHWSVDGEYVPSAAAAWDSVYLPGRNLLLLSQAGLFCAAREIPLIVQALLKGNPFSDAAPKFRALMEKTLLQALGHRVKIAAPYARLSKAQVISLIPGLPLQLTFSCLRPRSGRHCGRCSKCAERSLAASP